MPQRHTAVSVSLSLSVGVITSAIDEDNDDDDDVVASIIYRPDGCIVKQLQPCRSPANQRSDLLDCCGRGHLAGQIGR